MKKLFISLLLLSSSAFAQGWVPVGTVSSGTSYAVQQGSFEIDYQRSSLRSLIRSVNNTEVSYFTVEMAIGSCLSRRGLASLTDFYGRRTVLPFVFNGGTPVSLLAEAMCIHKDSVLKSGSL